MAIRSVRTAAALVALALAAWIAAPAPAAGPFSFPHRPHLSADALAGKSDQDCRVCHDYTKPSRDAHLDGCATCHVDDAHLTKRLSTAPRRPEFQHREHLFAKDGSPRRDMACATCHPMTSGGDWVEFAMPAPGLGPKTPPGATAAAKSCADCHAVHEPAGGLVRHDEKTGDGQACAACHAKDAPIVPLAYRPGPRTWGERPFLHKDHGGAAADCAKCHDAIRRSKTIWDHDPTTATEGKCESCHLDSAKRPLVAVSAAKTKVERIDFSRFPHAAHLGEFTRMQCRTCHYPETDAAGSRIFPQRAASAEPVSRDQLLDFKACDVCHGHDDWAPGKKSWHVDGHGVGAWSCFKCHQGGADAAGKLPIATADVERRSLGESKVAAHAHPGVTRAGAPLANAMQPVGGAQKACTDCHIGDAKELASRLAGRPFAHEPHLPAAPTSADCTVCHLSSAVSRRSEDLARFDAHVRGGPAPTGAAASVKGCLDCHAGATAADLGLELPLARRTVPQFDHAGHVRVASLTAGAKGMACTQCHTKGGTFGYQTPPEVANCTGCHAHEGDAAKVARTGPKSSQGDGAKCLLCHDEVRGEAAGRVGSPPRETFERSHLALRDGVQHHDKGGDCAACHVRDGAASTPYTERIEKAVVKLSIHDDPAFAGRPFNDPKGDCAACHRTPPRSYLRSLSSR